MEQKTFFETHGVKLLVVAVFLVLVALLVGEDENPGVLAAARDNYHARASAETARPSPAATRSISRAKPEPSVFGPVEPIAPAGSAPSARRVQADLDPSAVAGFPSAAREPAGSPPGDLPASLEVEGR